ncbi:MAG TPA: methyltransferase [Opitutales bacterium]|nr:methyltransferase [Opitutales bacterium]
MNRPAHPGKHGFEVEDSGGQSRNLKTTQTTYMTQDTIKFRLPERFAPDDAHTAPAVQVLMNMATGYWQAAALSAAVELGVFPCVSKSAATAAAIARGCQADVACMTDLLDALTGLEILDKTGKTYRLAPEFEPYLNPDSPTCMLGALQYNSQLYFLWGRLANCVRTGQAEAPPQDHLGGNAEATRGFVMAMHARALGIAPLLLSGLPIEPDARLLDVGSGPGTFSRMLAERSPEMEITQFDLPHIIHHAGELSASSSAAERIKLVSGDYRNDSLPAGHDTILYCGALHQETPESADKLFRKFHDALPVGGKLLVVDLMTEPCRTAPVFGALFSLNMKLFNPAAQVYSTEQVDTMLRKTGFDSITHRALQPVPYFCLTGIKS